MVRRGIFFAKIVVVCRTNCVSVTSRQQGRFSGKGNNMIESTDAMKWQDDDEVTTTFASLKLAQQQAYEIGFAAGVASVQKGENK